jgi:hypothetical protein
MWSWVYAAGMVSGVPGTDIETGMGMLTVPARRDRRTSGLTRSVACALLATFVTSTGLLAGQDMVAVPLAERHRGAERVIVGHVAAVNPVWKENEYGDRLIISIVRVTIDETLKGQVQPSIDVEVEGGTIGELSLRVSDLATFVPGDRAVFYLTRNPRGEVVPYLRGQGLLKLDGADRVTGTSTTLDEVRRAAAAARR